MYVGMIETRSLKILLKIYHENYSDLFKKIKWCIICYELVQFAAKNIEKGQNDMAWRQPGKDFSKGRISIAGKKA